MPPKQQMKRKRQLIAEAKKGREARKALRLLSSSKQDGTAAKKSRLSSSAAAIGPSTSSSYPSHLEHHHHHHHHLPVPPYPSMSSLMGHMDTGAHSSSTTFPLPPPLPPEPPSPQTSSSTPPSSKRPEDVMKNFAEEWKNTLDPEDLKSLAVFLCHVFTSEFDLSHSKAAERTAKIIGKTERTIRQWRTDLVTHGEIKESKKGKYERPKVLWQNKELNDKARTFVQANTAFMVQGKQSTMKVKDFCQWVNETLLPNQAVASLYSFVPGYGYAPTPSTPAKSTLPQKISMETARKWLRELGF